MALCYLQWQKQNFQLTCLLDIEHFILFAILSLKVHALHDVIIFELKSLIIRN